MENIRKDPGWLVTRDILFWSRCPPNKRKVPVARMIEEFQEQSLAISIPYPPDTFIPKLGTQEQQVKSDEFESNSRVSEYKELI
nr:unnamed protein product [Callosobruchus chinensis]